MKKAQFVDYLVNTLIPDLRASGSDATADDFQTAVDLLQQQPQIEFVIANSVTPGLYWSNDDGWVDLASADRFTEASKETLNLPMEGAWQPRNLDVLETVLSYALSNVDDINDAFYDSGVSEEHEADVLFVQSRYIGMIEESEIEKLLAEIREMND